MDPGTAAVRAFADLLLDGAAGERLAPIVEAHRDAVAAFLDDPDTAPSLARRHASRLRSRHQFARAGAGDLEDAFEALVRRLSDAVEGDAEGEALVAAIDATLAAHRGALGEPAGAEVTCAEYGAELQLALLGLAPDALAEPILDVGCGSEAALVRALRARGKEACGIDRAAPAGVAGVERADWLAHPFEPDRWGTVLSHQGFSLHFLHQHLADPAAAEAYARKYMEILRSLRPGGVFAYAPGLPFVEELLPPERYRVARQPIELRAGDPQRREWTRLLGTDPLYACRVTRAMRCTGGSR